MILITPADVALPAFRLGRTPEFGDALAADPGQVVGQTNGTQQFVHVTRLARDDLDLVLLGLDDAEYFYLREYIAGTLKGGKERFTLEFGKETNLVSSSERFDFGTTDWSGPGTPAPLVTVADESVVGPSGYTDTTQVNFFGSGGYTPLRLSSASLGLTVGEQLYVRMLVKILGGAGDQAISIGTPPVTVQGTVPDDGGFHWVGGGFSPTTNLFIDIDPVVSVDFSVAMAQVQVSRGSLFPQPYQKMPRPGGSNSMLWPSRFQAKRGKAGWDIRLAVRREIIPA